MDAGERRWEAGGGDVGNIHDDCVLVGREAKHGDDSIIFIGGSLQRGLEEVLSCKFLVGVDNREEELSCSWELLYGPEIR